jgi:axial budding pattern protein 2
MTDVLFFILAFLTANLANAANSSTAVTVLQSINNQLPLVARSGQPYFWMISPLTFSSTGSLSYTTSSLPGWLSFDADTQTFRGTPSAKDVGYPEIILTAHAAESSASSKFTICVTHDPVPTLKRPLEQQFVPNSRSLSSVYFLRNNSALSTSRPALRIPRKWSFSIGMDADMFAGPSRMFYELRLANGLAIPDYLNFNSRTVTLDGVIPPADKLPQPSIIPCVLHASDQEGYTAALLPFDLIVADHELSLSQTVKSLPTINITIASPFVATLSSSMDYMGVLADGDPIQPFNISSLDIDVSKYPWLRYDMATRTLFGTPGDEVTGTTPELPVILTTSFNQSIVTAVALNLVESYFSLPVLPSLHVSQGKQIVVSLRPWFSESNSCPGYDGTNLIASYQPTSAADFFHFDEYSANLTGIIPSSFHSTSDQITVSFTAYSNITRTTSHSYPRRLRS